MPIFVLAFFFFDNVSQHLRADTVRSTEYSGSYCWLEGIVQRSSQLAFASLDSLQRALVLALVLFGLGALFLGDPFPAGYQTLEQLTSYGETVGRETEGAAFDHATILPISQRPDQIGRLTRALFRAENHIRRRLMELTFLNKTSAAVVSTLDTQQAIDNILNEM